MNYSHDLMTIPEVADLFRVSPLTIKRWGNRGVLKFVRINSRGDRRYLRTEIEKLLGGNQALSDLIKGE